MKRLTALLVSAAAFFVCASAARAFQSGDGRTPTTPTTTPGGRGGRGPKTPVVKPPPPPPMARVSVHTSPAGSIVELDGRELGPSGPSGVLNLPPATPGQHTLVVRMTGYHEHRSVIDLASGNNLPLVVTLRPKPGHLNVLSKPSGGSIRVEGYGSYEGSVSDLELAHGTYRVSVSRLGYRTREQDVRIMPGSSSNVVVNLDRLPAGELLSLTESEFAAGRYATTVELGEMVIDELQSPPRLNLLLGLSHARLGRHQQAVAYLGRAIYLGESITVNVKHYHKVKKDERLCQGQLVLRRGGLEFRSGEYPTEGFVVPFGKLAGIRPDGGSGGRLNIRVLLPDPKKKKERKDKVFDYNFHPAEAFLVRKDPRKSNSPTLVACSDCHPAVQLIYQLIMQTGR